MKRLVYSGVRHDANHFAIDYTYNYPADLIDIVEPQLYQSIHKNKIFHFGYRFKDNVSSRDRTAFIHALKQIGDHPLTDSQVNQFIERPLAYLDDEINLYDIDCMVYPLSQRSPLVSKIVRCINDMTSHEMRRCSFEFVKKAPTDIGFDFEFFEFADPAEIERFSRLQGANILVVDDINTTGSTLNEILRKLGEVNSNANIYIYTLIGN